MIRRRDNEQVVIAQTAHSWLAGQFALQWGNYNFRFPARQETVIMTAINHDNGWQAWERAPQLDAQQRPTDFLEMPAAAHVAIWRESITQLAALNQYAGLLNSKHARFLVGLRVAAAKDTVADILLLQGFLAEQEAWETKMRARLQTYPSYAEACLTDNLGANLRLLQVFDWLSLLFCMGELTESVVPDVPGSAPAERLEIRLRPTGKQSLTVEPWPFKVPHFEVMVQTHHLEASTFETDLAFQSAWRQSNVTPMTFTVAAT